MTRRYVPVLTIAGSDSSGGAGVEADIKTISALGGYAAAAVTAVTAQNTTGVTAIHHVPADVVGAQIDAVMADIMPRAVKVGMAGTDETVAAIALRLAAASNLPVVVDPVMVATSGCCLADGEAVGALAQQLLPIATVLTPNLPEAERLAGHAIGCEAERADGACRMLEKGCRAVLIKGGHDDGGDTITDHLYWIDSAGRLARRAFTHPKVVTRNTHGTGCTLSSAIATYLAMGFPIVEAVEEGIGFLCQALAAGAETFIGKGHGPVNHLFAPQPMKMIGE